MSSRKAQARSDQSNQSGGRRHTRLSSSHCTVCHAIVLQLWLTFEPIRRWQAVMTPCDHVSYESITSWRYTKRSERAELGLPITDIGPAIRRPIRTKIAPGNNGKFVSRRRET